MKLEEKLESEKEESSDKEILYASLKEIKRIPKIALASTVYISAYVPFLLGFSTFVLALDDQLNGRNLNLTDIVTSSLATSLGYYTSFKLYKPAFKSFQKISGIEDLED